jgi:hypothetical protein
MTSDQNKLVVRRYIEEVMNTGKRIVEHGGAANSLEALLEIGAIRVVGPEKERDAEPDAPPNSPTPSQSRPPQGIQSFDSQRTSSSGGCG